MAGYFFPQEEKFSGGHATMMPVVVNKDLSPLEDGEIKPRTNNASTTWVTSPKQTTVDTTYREDTRGSRGHPVGGLERKRF
ncbi:hypothetical protein ElyMa_001702600 [Elysia marginata]|uniref:Uncharacterized protein n=1 Tax=Elysia marginata TaxID=1093978 RepID=A0AAV4JUM9_9GAST|nr:hypothetical protein ElyMa_001702600 [Elysia marginata]